MLSVLYSFKSKVLNLTVFINFETLKSLSEILGHGLKGKLADPNPTHHCYMYFVFTD